MAIVDSVYYHGIYVGTEASSDEFEALTARAEDMIAALTRYRVTADTIATLPELVQTLYKKAICAQIDYFAVNGLDIVAAGGADGYTVGRVSVHGGEGAAAGKRGAVSPLALTYLEQTGLLNPAVPVGPVVLGVGVC